MSGPEFQGRSGLLFLAAAISVAALVVLMVWDGPPPQTDRGMAGPKGRSASAPGAFVEWLRARGEDVRTSRVRTSDKLDEGDLVFFLEPRVTESNVMWVEARLFDAWMNGIVVLVLPKWVGIPDRSHPGWIESAVLENVQVPESTLDLALILIAMHGRWEGQTFVWLGDEQLRDDAILDETSVEETIPDLMTDDRTADDLTPGDRSRPHTQPTHDGDATDANVDTAPAPDETYVPKIARYDESAFGIPQLQTLSTDGTQWRPVVDGPDGIVAAELAPDFFVLVDPDLISNAGIGQGANGRHVLTLLSRIGEHGAIWIDESVHFASGGGSLWAELVRFPLVLITVHVLAFFALAAWAGTQRFGPTRGFGPRFHVGKEHLVEHTAELLQLAGHGGYSLARYLALIESDVSASLGWGELPRTERRRRLLALGQSVGEDGLQKERRDDLSTLEREVNELTGTEVPPAVLLQMAERIDAWRRGTLYGRRSDGAR